LLTFFDDTQVRVKGLDEILTDLYSKGRKANEETAEEIIDKLEAQKNFIPSSDRARKEYAYILLKEYQKYLKDRIEKNR
jgi:hypothetical protein